MPQTPLCCHSSMMRSSDSPSFNIQFVNIIKKYPVLYSASNMGYEVKEELETAWDCVAREVGESGETQRSAVDLRKFEVWYAQSGVAQDCATVPCP